MKKLALALFATAALTSAAFAQKTVSDGTVRFTGTITDAACSLKGVQPVDLGQPTVKAFEDANAKSSLSPNSYIEFEDCNSDDEGMTQVKLEILPGTKAGTSDFWANTAANSAATGVGVEVLVAGKTVTPVGAKDIEASILSDNTARFSVAGRIAKSGTDAVTAGEVEAEVKFLATYH